DGRRIAFGSNRTGAGMGIYIRPLSGQSGEQVALEMRGQFASPVDWSRDGRFLLYGVGPVGQASDLWAVAINGDRTPIAVANSRFTERLGQFSPDGQWVAYQSDESGRFEIYLQRFPEPGAKIVASAGGGIHPRWRSDGLELFYLNPEERLVAVPIYRTSDGAISPGVPTPLFTTNLGAAQPYSRQQYALSAGGQRFLMNTLDEPRSSVPVTLVLNWKGHMESR